MAVGSAVVAGDRFSSLGFARDDITGIGVTSGGVGGRWVVVHAERSHPCPCPVDTGSESGKTKKRVGPRSESGKTKKTVGP